MQPQRRNQRVHAEQAAEQQPEEGRRHTADHHQAGDRKPLAIPPAHGREDQPLADVAEHVAEHQWHDDGQQRCWVGLAGRWHAQRTAEDLERACPRRIAQQQRRLRARGRCRVAQQRAPRAALQRLGQPVAAVVARPAGDPAEQRPGFERVDVVQHPLQAVGVPQCTRQVVAQVQRRERGAHRVRFAFDGGQAPVHVDLVARRVGLQPAGHWVGAALERAHRLRHRLQGLGPAGDQQMRRAVDLQAADQRVEWACTRRQHQLGLDARRQHEQLHPQPRAGAGQLSGSQRARLQSDENALPQPQFAVLGFAALKGQDHGFAVLGPGPDRRQTALQRGHRRLWKRRRPAPFGWRPVGLITRRQIEILHQQRHHVAQHRGQSGTGARFKLDRTRTCQRLEHQRRIVARGEDLEPTGWARAQHQAPFQRGNSARPSSSARSRSRSSADSAR